jgi:hypothetical protein
MNSQNETRIFAVVAMKGHPPLNTVGGLYKLLKSHTNGFSHFERLDDFAWLFTYDGPQGDVVDVLQNCLQDNEMCRLFEIHEDYWIVQPKESKQKTYGP